METSTNKRTGQEQGGVKPNGHQVGPTHKRSPFLLLACLLLLGGVASVFFERALPKNSDAPKTSLRRWLQFIVPPAPPCGLFCHGIPPGGVPSPSRPRPSPPRPSPATPSRPSRALPLHFRVENKCREKVLLSIRYLEEDTNKWTSLCWWTLDPGDYALLAHKHVRVDTYNSVAYFYAFSKSYSWNGKNSRGSIIRSCGGYSLHMKKWTYIFENDLFLRLSCNSNRRLGSSMAGEESNDEDESDDEEEVTLDFTPNMGCWSEEGTRIDGTVQPPPCMKGELPLEDEQEMSSALKHWHYLDLDEEP